MKVTKKPDESRNLVQVTSRNVSKSASTWKRVFLEEAFFRAFFRSLLQTEKFFLVSSELGISYQEPSYGKLLLGEEIN